MKKNYSKKGFTLIELLVVIAIIGLLSSMVITQLQTARRAARDSQRKQHLVQLRNALELYRSDHGQYPPTPACGARTHCWMDSVHNPTDYIPGLVPKYISVLPLEPDQDPNLCKATVPPTTGDAQGTSYRYLSDGTRFKIHDHCAPISAPMTHIGDPLYYCPGGSGHPNSWGVYGGSSTADFWCDAGTDNGGTSNSILN